MSGRQSLKSKSQKKKQQHNIKPSHAKKNSLKFKTSKSSKTSSKKKKKKIVKKKSLRTLPKLPAKFSKSVQKINNIPFYKNNAAIVNEKVEFPYSEWQQTVDQYSNSYTESLNITFKADPKINSSYFKTQQTEKQLWTQLTKSKKIFVNTMRKLFKPYIDINSIVDIILLYNGPHILPIRYSVDILPYFHSTIRSQTARKCVWTTAAKDNINSQCILDFTPDTNIMIVEDIYDEWVAYIKRKFSLRSKFSESAIFYIAHNKSFMEVNSAYLNNESHAKQIFTELYIDALCNFAICNDYAFRLQLYGINYRYYLQKRRRSPSISWGSRSRCWSGEGMVLLSDGTEKQIKYLSVGDEVTVLQTLPNGVNNKCNTATVKVKIESVVNRKYEMVLVDKRVWISPYHAILNRETNKWQLPCQVSNIEERFEKSIFNFILDAGHVLCVNGVWACTLGHDLRGDIIENPMWGSSQVMYDMWSKVDGYPNIVEYI